MNQMYKNKPHIIFKSRQQPNIISKKDEKI